MKTSEFLQHTRVLYRLMGLRVSGFTGLCYFTFATAQVLGYTEHEHLHLRVTDHINTLLGEHVMLNSWIAHRLGIRMSYGKLDFDTEDKLHRTRLAWLADLIDYYESQGD